MYDIKNTIDVKKDKIKVGLLEYFWFALIFLYSMNFLGKANLFLLLIFLVSVTILLIKLSNVTISVDILFLFLFSISYFFILFLDNNLALSDIFLYFIAPTMCFSVGYFVTVNNILLTMMAIIYGNFFHGLLNLMIYFKLYGYTTNILGIRAIPDIWSGNLLTATLQGTNFTLIISTLFYLHILAYNKKNKMLLICMFLCVMFAIYAALILGNRTLIFIMLINYFVSIILYFSLTKSRSVCFLKILIFMVFVFCFTSYMYINNYFNIGNFIQNTTLYMRSDIILLEDSRFEVYKKVIRQMFDYPLGGYKIIIGLSYAHNLWLDVLFAAGLLPFIFLIAFTLKSIINMFNLIKSSGVDMQFKILAFGIFMGYFLNFMVEPILEGVPHMFMSFCIFCGMTKKYIDTVRFNYKY